MHDTLIISVSGVRGIVGAGLTPELVSRFSSSLGMLAKESGAAKVVLARDSRPSGPMFAAAAQAGLQSVGCGVIDCGLVPTPTAQLAVEHHGAGGGIVITASHNPVEWNGLKFIGPDGVFLDAETDGRLRALAEGGMLAHVGWDALGALESDPSAVQRHLDAVMALPNIDVARIRKRRFTVALDGVRGVGGTIMPQLLEWLGCRVVGMDLETDGAFSRSPEPLPEHLAGLRALVRDSGADLGMAMDPDGDRLALVDEGGRPIGEDYTLAVAVRAVLSRTLGPVVVNLSTSLVVDDAARAYGIEVVRARVGEANVARAMRACDAVVGGEGNGGVMLPALHLGRDAPVAAGLVLQHLVDSGKTLGELVADAPSYSIVKAKVPRGGDLDATYDALAGRFSDATVDRQDGLRLAWAEGWLHVRPSGTEPIVRLIAEAPTAARADELIEAAKTAHELQQTQ
ncbi:MAG: phosphoglucosamine mutase [Gemmatimonadetes bacterium]|nr:phosphoglucosamine mutase [Gemmatimonadota bacterium]